MGWRGGRGECGPKCYKFQLVLQCTTTSALTLCLAQACERKCQDRNGCSCCHHRTSSSLSPSVHADGASSLLRLLQLHLHRGTKRPRQLRFWYVCYCTIAGIIICSQKIFFHCRLKITPANRNWSRPKLVHMHMSSGDNVREIFGAFGYVWAKWGEGLDESRAAVFLLAMRDDISQQLIFTKFGCNT